MEPAALASVKPGQQFMTLATERWGVVLGGRHNGAVPCDFGGSGDRRAPSRAAVPDRAGPARGAPVSASRRARQRAIEAKDYARAEAEAAVRRAKAPRIHGLLDTIQDQLQEEFNDRRRELLGQLLVALAWPAKEGHEVDEDMERLVMSLLADKGRTEMPAEVSL